ncbi:MAG: ATP-binding protein [Candidatus Aminicenantales bacterium]
MNTKSYPALVPLLVLLTLCGLNIYKKITWKEPTDGVIWKKKPVGLVAVKIETSGPGFIGGLKKGDILYSINGEKVENLVDLKKQLWLIGTNQTVSYEIVRYRGEQPIKPNIRLSQKRVNYIYLFLVLVGLTSLVVALFIFINSNKPLEKSHVHFYALCFSFFCFQIFSATGKLDFLDSVFYWIDNTAFLFFPPLLLHFFLKYPQRKPSGSSQIRAYLFYLPALFLFILKIALHLPFWNRLGEGTIISFYSTLERLDLLHFIFFSLACLGSLIHRVLKPSNILIKKQLKWLINGLAFSFIPFTLVYLVPYLLGQLPSRAAELSVLLQALMPLTLAYSISSARLMDFGVILKKAITLLFAYVVIGGVYIFVSSQTRFFYEYRINAIILGILAIILGATLFSPLKNLFQSLVDRLFYKRSYKYRKTLLFISKELSRERNLHKLSHSLLDLIANALSLKNIALLLPQEENSPVFFILCSKGDLVFSENRLIFDRELYQSLLERDYLTVYSFPDQKELERKFRELCSFGLFHFMPFKVEEKIVGCLGMGKKEDNTFLSSEDWDLLTTISSPVALALENAYLYNQINIRALELERLKDYSENIIESLTVGVAVLDQKGRIIGWNRILEEKFLKKKEEVMNRSLIDVIGRKNFSAIFPSDTQQDYRLLSEITVELPSSEEAIFDIAKTPLLDNQMQPYGTIIVFEDITERISLQQQLLTSEKLASIGLLSAGVAHEINTPLTGISSYVQLLQKKLSGSPHTQILEKIEAQTDRVGRIIKNLLNFARNPSDFSFNRIDLRENLREIISLIEYKLRTMNIKLELNLSPLKPIWAQGERLQQVFINIILNAIDAMPGGGKLKIELFQKNSEAVVNIMDNGTGIKKQHLPHIFDPFFTTKGIGKGTGLGLSISYAIIREHEGKINVESEEGKGSLFSISIPLDLDKRKSLKSPPSPE